MSTLFLGEEQMAKDFWAKIHRYPQLASSGIIFVGAAVLGGGVQYLRFQGRGYHAIGSILPDAGHDPVVAQLDISDSDVVRF